MEFQFEFCVYGENIDEKAAQELWDRILEQVEFVDGGFLGGGFWEVKQEDENGD